MANKAIKKALETKAGKSFSKYRAVKERGTKRVVNYRAHDGDKYISIDPKDIKND